MSARVLVADDDLWVLRMISTVLERQGHSVTLASDGEEALASALSRPPDLLITDINMPRMDGWELISAMRERAELVAVPVIVLTELDDEDSRVRGYRLGVEDYVSKPFRFEELDLRVSRTLRRAAAPEDNDGEPAAPEPESPPDVGLVGTLDQVSLSSLLTLLELDRKSGVLHLSRDGPGEPPAARVFLIDGRCAAAEPEGAEAPADAELIYELLGWDSGRFEFNQQDVDVDHRIAMSTTGLLMEGARRQDEAARDGQSG